MKVFISADIEGTAGIAHWDEANAQHADYAQFSALMTAEVVAACEGARAAGASEVLIKDAHWSGRNILVGELPDYARLIRGWSGHPDGMMFGVGADCAAAIYTGYHSKAGSEANPLAHTSTLRISRLLLNGEVASELTLNALCAARYGVPSAFVSGDAGICEDARAMIPGVTTVETMTGVGASTNSLAPKRARAAIREGVEAALKAGDLRGRTPTSAESYELTIEFSNPHDAYNGSWYPGARVAGPRAISFVSGDFFEILRAYKFMKG